MNSITSKSGKQIIYREPTLADVPALFAFYEKLTPENTFIWSYPDNPKTLEEQETEIKTYLENQNDKLYYVGFHQDTLVAYMSMDRLGRRQTHIGLYGIIIAREYRGDGIGEALTKIHLEDSVKKLALTKVILETFGNNQAAQKLYAKLGFTEYGRLPGGIQFEKDLFVDNVLMYQDY